MKVLPRISLLAFLCLSVLNVTAQSGYFARQWLFSSIDGIQTAYPVQTTIYSKTPDLGGKGDAILYEGNPSREQVHEDFFKYVQNGQGRFYKTEKSTNKISFQLDYGYDYDDDKRIFFDSIIASQGDIGNESNIEKLTRNEISYDCNIVDQNCFVVQRYYYQFDRSKLSMNHNNLYTKLLIFRYYKYNKVVKTMILPVVVTGTSWTYLGHAAGPMELISILRTPPGDQSSMKLTNSTEMTTEISQSFTKTNSETQTGTITASVGFEEGPVSGGASLESTRSESYSKTQGKENTYSFKFRFEDEFSNDFESDLFIIKQYEYDYYFEFTVSTPYLNSGNLFVQASQKMLMYPLDKELQSMQVTEQELLTATIPDLLQKNEPAKAKYFQDIIAMNQRIKADAVDEGSVITGAITRRFTSTASKSETITQEISVETENSVKFSDNVGIEIGPVEAGVEASIEKKWSVSTTMANGTSQGVEESKQIEFTIADDELNSGDKLVIQTRADRTFGTPIFVLDEGLSKTSWPYEGGIQRDKPGITVMDPVTLEQVKSAKFSDLEEGEEVVFSLRISNNSDEPRSYYLKIPNTINKPKIDTNEDLGEAFEMAQGEIRTIDLRVSNPKIEARGFEDFEVLFQPLYDTIGADRVFLSAFYGATDKNRPPDNNLVCNALILPVDNSLQTTYTNKFGVVSNISNKNSYSGIEEQILTPPADCTNGWCPETGGNLAEITSSVWFKFVVISPELVISACEDMNTGFNSQMAVYSVGDCDDLSTFQLLAANDDGCTGNSSRIYLDNLNFGDTLYLLVDGFQGAQSDFGLRLSSPAPRIDNACMYELLSVDGQPVHFNNYLATAEENEQMLTPFSTDPVYGWKSDSIQSSVWFNFVAPPGGEVIIDLENATFDTQLGLYATEGNICGPEWFRTYSKLAFNDDITFQGGHNSRLTYKGLTKGKAYLILVDGFKGQTGEFDIKISIPKPKNDEACYAISLDNNTVFQGPFSNGGATSSTAEQALAPPYVESGENGWTDEPVNEFARQVEKSVWFKFVAPPSGSVEISTWNQTNFITQLALYEVGSCGDFASYRLIAAEDNSHIRQVPPDDEYPNGRGVRGSILNITDLEADSVYYLMIDGSMNDVGVFSIDIIASPPETPVNDEVCEAYELPVDGTVQGLFTNHAASADTIEDNIVPAEVWKDGSMNSSVWFKFTAPSDGDVEISTCNLANFDTQLAVYAVGDCASLETFELVAANEDGPTSCSTNGDSYLPVYDLKAGDTYYVVVDGYGNDMGHFSIVINDDITPGPVNDYVLEAILLPVNGEVQTGFSNSLATASEFEQMIHPRGASTEDCLTGWCDELVENSVWFKFIAPSGGMVYISTCDLADFDTQLALYDATDVNDFNTFTLVAANDAGPDDCSTFFDSYLPVEGLTAGKTYYIMVDGFDGANGNFDIVLSTDGRTTSVLDMNEPDQFRTYPNPFESIVYLDYSKSLQLVELIEVKDISGKVVLQVSDVDQINGNIQIDLSAVPAGIWFLQIHTNEGVSINKMIKY